MNEVKKFCGLGTALVTPFIKGHVDIDAYRTLVERQVAGGVDFLVALGTTAETPCLTDSEKELLVKTTREIYNGPLMVGVGTNSVGGTLHNMRLLEHYDIDAWLVVAPYYNKPGQEGLFRYFEAVAASTHRNVVLYNIPGRTGVNIEPSTIARCSVIENIIGIKDACPIVEHLRAVRAAVPHDFIVLSGNDDQWLEMSRIGFNGVISVVSNIVPRLMADIAKAIVAGNFDKATVLDSRLRRLYKACFVESNPIPVKTALHLLGLCLPDMRLPLTNASRETQSLLAETLRDINIL